MGCVFGKAALLVIVVCSIIELAQGNAGGLILLLSGLFAFIVVLWVADYRQKKESGWEDPM